MTTVTNARARFEGLSRNQRIAAVVLGLFLCRGCSLALTPSEADNKNATATAAAETQATLIAQPSDTPRPTSVPQPVLDEPTDTDEPPTATDEPAATAIPTKRPPISTSKPLIKPTAPVLDLNPDEDQNCSDHPRDELVRWWNFYRTADRPNPGRLDGDGDGVICEADSGGGAAAPATAVPAQIQPFIQQPAPAEQPSGGHACAGALKCDTFATHAEAQEYFERCGRPARMDSDHDGQACEGLP